MKANLKSWIIGIGLAVVGVILARLVSNRFEEQLSIRLAMYFGGVVLALAGIGVILFGMRRK